MKGATLAGIVDLILADHALMRKMTSDLRALEGAESSSEEVEKAWESLASLLEAHADAEEAVLYPRIAAAVPDGGDQAEDATKEHNEIRDSIGEVEEHDVGSELFWLAVAQVAAVNEHHMAEEEQEILPSFNRSSTQSDRDELGQSFEEYKRENG